MTMMMTDGLSDGSNDDSTRFNRTYYGAMTRERRSELYYYKQRS